MRELVELSRKTISLKRNEYLTIHGDVDTNVYYVKSGSLKVYVLDGNEEQIIRFGYKDNFIVLLDSFLTGRPTIFNIQAIKKTEIIVISKTEVEEFKNHEINKVAWIQLLESLVLQQIDREIDILTNSTEERYKRVLNRSPQLFQEIPNRYIANYLRMSPETLSRLKKS